MSQASASQPVSGVLRPPWLSTDAQLAARAAAGDRRAFAAIFERHHQDVYRYCLSILRDREDAADALQSTMAAAVRGLEGETRRMDLKPWLMRIARNESITLLRSRRPADRIQDGEHAAAGGPEVEVLRSEDVRQALADIGHLPERPRSALVMRELNGMSYADIGAALGSTEGAARQAVCEARTMLHEIAEGRGMACVDVRELISASDGRRLRARRVRAHLRGCPSCNEFRAAIGHRRAGFAAAVPVLPAPAAASILQGVLGGSGASGAGMLGAAGIAGAVAPASAVPAQIGAGVLSGKIAAAAVGSKTIAAAAAGTVALGGGTMVATSGGDGSGSDARPIPAEQVAAPVPPPPDEPFRGPMSGVSIRGPVTALSTATAAAQRRGGRPSASTDSPGRARGRPAAAADRPVSSRSAKGKPVGDRGRPSADRARPAHGAARTSPARAKAKAAPSGQAKVRAKGRPKTTPAPAPTARLPKPSGRRPDVTGKPPPAVPPAAVPAEPSAKGPSGRPEQRSE